MQRGLDYKQFAVLFVDDEEMARKYFALGLQADLRVLTAPGVDEALAIIEREGDSIGVVVTDQRMPGKQGVDLLTEVRKTYPEIVRLLTTAYSDLSDAIAAVNSGEIFRYLSKPWNPQVLRAEIVNAMTFFLMRNERNLLLKEKLSVWQRLIQTNRTRDLVVLAGSLTHLRNPLHATHALLDRWADGHYESSIIEKYKLDHWGLMRDEITRMLITAQHVSDMVRAAETTVGFTEPLDLQALLPDVALVIPSGGVSAATINRALLRRLFQLLSDILSNPEKAVCAEAMAKADGSVCVTLTGTSSHSPGAALHAPTSDHKTAEILAAWYAIYLIATHHGGNIAIATLPDNGLKVTLTLPVDPNASVFPPLRDDWLEDIFIRYEGWEK